MAQTDVSLFHGKHSADRVPIRDHRSRQHDRQVVVIENGESDSSSAMIFDHTGISAMANRTTHKAMLRPTLTSVITRQMRNRPVSMSQWAARSPMSLTSVPLMTAHLFQINLGQLLEIASRDIDCVAYHSSVSKFLSGGMLDFLPRGSELRFAAIGSRCYGRWGRIWLDGQNAQCWSRSSTIILSAPTYQGIECLDVHFLSAKSVGIGEQRIRRHQTDVDRMPPTLGSINNLVSSAIIVVVCLTWIPLPR